MMPIPAAWSAESAAKLAGVLGDDPREIIEQIEAGVAELWQYGNGSYVVTRLEHEPNGKRWLVLVAGAGANLKSVVGWWCQFAEEKKLAIRIHSERAGMLKMLKPFGFEAAETIYKKEV